MFSTSSKLSSNSSTSISSNLFLSINTGSFCSAVEYFSAKYLGIISELATTTSTFLFSKYLFIKLIWYPTLNESVYPGWVTILLVYILGAVDLFNAFFTGLHIIFGKTDVYRLPILNITRSASSIASITSGKTLGSFL